MNLEKPAASSGKRWMARTLGTDSWSSFFWTILLILFVRGFIVEPFKIPSGSMIPTLLIGDHLFVAKSSYDIGIPFTNIKLLQVGSPRRGDVVVFEYPNHEAAPELEGIYYIKRLIGLPGDTIEVRGGVPVINGVKANVQLASASEEALPGYKHPSGYGLQREDWAAGRGGHWVRRADNVVQRLPHLGQELRSFAGRDCLELGSTLREGMNVDFIYLNEICPFKVPEGKYFFMGDNRDESSDSRKWGFADHSQLKGRALFIWMSIGGWGAFGIPVLPILRWSRMGLGVN